MRIHCYGDSYYYFGDKVLKLDETQFLILKEYIEKDKNITKLVEIIIGSQEVTREEFIVIESNVREYVDAFINNYNDDFDTMIVSGELGKFYPRVLNIELTNFCNLNCWHCYKEACSQNNKFLNIDLIDYICNYFSGKIQLIHLTGGEPLSHPKINEIISKLRKSNFEINITTNGTLIDKLNYENLKAINNFQISIYGYDKRSYIFNTKADSFDSVIMNIKRLDELKIKYDISYLANKDYLDYYKEYNAFLNSLSYKNIILGFADVVGRLKKSKNWQLTDSDKEIIEKRFTDISYIANENEKCEKWCHAGTFSYSLREDGKLFLCQAITDEETCIGDIYSLSLRINDNKFDIWKYLLNNKKYISEMCKFKEVIK